MNYEGKIVTAIEIAMRQYVRVEAAKLKIDSVRAEIIALERGLKSGSGRNTYLNERIGEKREAIKQIIESLFSTD